MINSEKRFLFDLDGTITKKEILPEIAKEIGLYNEIAELTEKTIKGLIPFHESFLKRVELFKNIPINIISDIVEEIPLHDNIVNFIRDNQNRCIIVTGNLDVWIEPLCKKIGVDFLASKAIYVDNCLLGVSEVMNKGEVAKKIYSPFVAIGEGNNDAEMISLAEVGIGYGGVHQPAKSVFSSATHIIYEEGTLCRFLKLL